MISMISQMQGFAMNITLKYWVLGIWGVECVVTRLLGFGYTKMIKRIAFTSRLPRRLRQITKLARGERAVANTRPNQYTTKVQNNRVGEADTVLPGP